MPNVSCSNREEAQGLEGFLFGSTKRKVFTAFFLSIISILTVKQLIAFASGPVSFTWEFDNAGNYVYSDDTQIEVASSLGRLKTREYQTDPNTVLLLHMNENAGSTVGDSSGYGFTGSISNATWTTGILGYGLNFGGSNSVVTVAHDPSLNLNQQHTVEVWAKLDNPLSAYSGRLSQTLLDKGEYKLYFDYSTGKLTYEVARNGAETWTRIAGGSNFNQSWDFNSRRAITALETSGNILYAGLGLLAGDAEVWSYDLGGGPGATWTKIGGDGINGGWINNKYEHVHALKLYNGKLYAGLGNTANSDAEVWEWDGSTWTLVGPISTWTNIEYVYSLEVYDDGSGEKLYAGTGLSTDDGRIYRWEGSTSWTQIAGHLAPSPYSLTSWGNPDNIDSVLSLLSDGSFLYAGTGLSADDGDLWRWDGTSWKIIGGTSHPTSETVNGGWDDVSDVFRVDALFRSGEYLYAGMGNSTTDIATLWRLNVAIPEESYDWVQIGGLGLESPFSGGWGSAEYDTLTSVVVLDEDIYAGFGFTSGDADVWRVDVDGGTWEQIGGDGLNSGWTTANASLYIDEMRAINGELYVAVTNTSDAGEIWKFNGTTWEQIAGAYVNESWGYFGIENVETSVSWDGKLVVGLGQNTDGDAQVWEFDDTEWKIIGGQGVRGSWSRDYAEVVYDLVDYKGKLYAGIGDDDTDDKGEVWEYDGTLWQIVGGDDCSEWCDTNNGINYAYSLATDGDYLYAGLGGANDESEIWRWDGTTWVKIGGDGSGWNTSTYTLVASLLPWKGDLYAGTGTANGRGDVFRWRNGTWTLIGGGGANSDWSTNDIVQDMAIYRGELYAALGGAAGEAEVWKYNFTTGNWGGSPVGGSGVNNSWISSVYEHVYALTVYNGYLYASLGLTAGEGEVWRYDGTTWEQVGGDTLNDGWDATTIERVDTLLAHKGKLYAGLGASQNADAQVWSFGNNVVLESATSSYASGEWNHYAVTYDGAQLTMFKDGVMENSSSVSTTLHQGTLPLYLGGSAGGEEAGSSDTYLRGQLDEVRISNNARTTFITTPYATTKETITPISAQFTSQIKNWTTFSAEDPTEGAVNYRLSHDNGSNWKYYSGGLWTDSTSLTDHVNTEAELSSHISTFPVTSEGILWQAVFSGDGQQRPSIDFVTIGAQSDTDAPSNPSLLTPKDSAVGSVILETSNTYAYLEPYFAWSGASDGIEGSGISGYWVYFGVDSSANVLSAGVFQQESSFSASGLNDGSTYYLRIQTMDKALNNSSAVWAPFIYTYKTIPPTPSNVAYISAAGGTFGNIEAMSFTWPEGGASGAKPFTSGPAILGYQYSVNSTSNWTGDLYDGGLGIEYIASGYTQPFYFSVARDSSSFVVGENTIYFRSVDAAGNFSNEDSRRADTITYGGEAPKFVASCANTAGITISPSSSNTNLFSLSWSPAAPADGNFVTDYYYMVNTSVPANLNTIQNNPAAYFNVGTSTSVSNITLPGAVKGSNTVFIVAKDDNEHYAASNCIKGVFILDSTNPDPPKNVSASDASIKSTGLWRASLGWDVPDYTGTGTLTYKIERSLNGTSWTSVATTTGTAYVDTVPDSKQYYWRVGAYDTSSSSQAAISYAAAVTMVPKGTFTEPPSISGDPLVTGVTTQRATISWSTNRTADTKVQFGTSKGKYFDEEPSKSEQVTSHTIDLTNLKPGTTYYFRTKWTDEDGNTGTSKEYSFSTHAAPEVIDPKIVSTGISGATLEFVVTGAQRARVYYGESTSFGGISDIYTSTSRATYTVTLSGLRDGTKYYYKVNTFDSENAEYEGSVLSFDTLPRPRIADVRIQQVRGAAQPTVLITWSTNTEVSSIVTYYPLDNPSGARDDVNVALRSGQHRMILRGLLPQKQYSLVVSGRDLVGNEASSEAHTFTTSTDTRPPLISDLKIETSNVRLSGGERQSQMVISWNTDEPATSQIEYGEGTGSSYSQRSQEDTNLTFNHLVVVSGLTPSKVYHLRAISKDDAGNETRSIDTVTITPKATDSAFDLVLANLQEAFGFLGNVNR